MKSLSRQRIRYLIEFGGLYPAEEPASKNFVVKWLTIIAAAQTAALLWIDYLFLN